MALLKENLWDIVSGTEVAPNSTDGTTDRDANRKFIARRDKALAIIVLAVDPSLLYLLGEPEDPKIVWQTLQGQFQKKTWANKLGLWRKLFSLKLVDGGSVKDHVKAMTEIFNELAVVGDPVDEED